MSNILYRSDAHQYSVVVLSLFIMCFAASKSLNVCNGLRGSIWYLRQVICFLRYWLMKIVPMKLEIDTVCDVGLPVLLFCPERRVECACLLRSLIC